MFRTPLKRNMIGQKMGITQSSPYPAAPVVIPTFSPTSITGCIMWYAADLITGVTTDNTPVTSWTDGSGTGRHATQNSSGSQPAFKTNIKNSKPCVRFNGTSDRLLITSASFTSGSSFFFVLNPSGSGFTGGSWIAFHGAGEYDYDTGNTTLIHAASSTGIIHYWRASRPGVTTDSAINSIGQYTFTIENIGGGNINQRFRRNTTELKNYNFAASANSTPSEGTIGARFQPTLGSPFVKADIFEIIVYDRFISTTDRDTVEAYLNTKYAIY